MSYVLVDASSVTETTTTSAVHVPGGANAGGACFLDVTAVSGGSPTLQVTVQDQIGSDWRDMFNFSSVSAVAKRMLARSFQFTESVSDLDYDASIAAQSTRVGPLGDRLRVVYTIGGSTPVFSFVVYFIPI